MAPSETDSIESTSIPDENPEQIIRNLHDATKAHLGLWTARFISRLDLRPDQSTPHSNKPPYQSRSDAATASP
jgi:hypothetical protein